MKTTNFVIKWTFSIVSASTRVARWPFFGPFLANVAIFESHFLEKKLFGYKLNFGYFWELFSIKNYWWLFGYFVAIFSNFNLATLASTYLHGIDWGVFFYIFIFLFCNFLFFNKSHNYFRRVFAHQWVSAWPDGLFSGHFWQMWLFLRAIF